MSEYQVGDAINETALEEFSGLLKQAYANGEANGGSMDWNDVQKALDKAVEAIGAESFMEVASSDEGFEDEPTLMLPQDASGEVRAAAALVVAYQNPESVDWEDVDTAWDILLQTEVEAGVKPTR